MNNNNDKRPPEEVPPLRRAYAVGPIIPAGVDMRDEDGDVIMTDEHGRPIFYNQPQAEPANPVAPPGAVGAGRPR